MASGRGHNSRSQPRNSRGQFAPARKLILVDSDPDVDVNQAAMRVAFDLKGTGGKRIKGEASSGGKNKALDTSSTKQKAPRKKKALDTSAKGMKWAQSSSTKKKVQDDSDTEVSSYAFYTDSDVELSDFEEDDDPVDMDLLKALVQEAKAEAKSANKRYKEKLDCKIDDTYERLYCDIRDSVLPQPKQKKLKKGRSGKK